MNRFYMFYYFTRMKSYMSLRVARRYLVTALAILAIMAALISILSDRGWIVDYFKTNHQVNINVKQLQSRCPQEATSSSISTQLNRHEMYDICACPRANRTLMVAVNVGEEVVVSSCDAQATARGFNQTVVSYSFFGPVDSDYFLGITHNVLAVKQMYPGYVMRLYHDLDVVRDVDAYETLCDLWCDNDHLDLCNVRHLPYDLCDQHRICGTIWRFLVLGDPLVARFLIRDIDGHILPREVDSVKDWIGNSEGKTWHIMRDHPFHATSILAGMWGGTNTNLTMTTALRKIFVDKGISKNIGHDQKMLENILWPLVQNDMVSHDSYLCQHYNGSKPWPTRRETRDFVGNKFPWKERWSFIIDKQCPRQCRPKEHKDWLYC